MKFCKAVEYLSTVDSFPKKDEEDEDKYFD